MSAARAFDPDPRNPQRPTLRVIEGGAATAGVPACSAADKRHAEPAAGPGPGSQESAPAPGFRELASAPGFRELAPGRVPGSRQRHRRGVLALAASAAGSFLLEPADSKSAGPPPTAPGPRLTIAVFGLAPGCGSTVISRALAVELALRDQDGAAAVSCFDLPAGFSLGSQAALRLARTVADVPGASTRSVGRLCLVAGAHPGLLAETVRHHAPLVIDGGSESLAGSEAALADRVVLVVSADQEPALAAVAARALEDDGPPPIVVANRVRPGAEHEWRRRDICVVPDSRVCSHLALSGRDLGGSFSRAIADLADRCESPI
jgi:hypothetical protein